MLQKSIIINESFVALHIKLPLSHISHTCCTWIYNWNLMLCDGEERCFLFCFILFFYNCEWNIISQKGLTTIIQIHNNSKWIKYQTLYQIYNRDYWYECWIIHLEICSIWFSIQERHGKYHHVSLSLSHTISLPLP